MNSQKQSSTWRYLDTGFLSGYENMAIDEAVFKSCQQGKSLPTIRLYGWTPPAVSLGYFQKAEKSVNLEACKRRGVDVVRRLSGGRAVLHDRELTYSLICPEKTPPFGNTILETYKTISMCLISALKNLNLDAKWVTSKDKHSSFRHLNDKTVSCFSSPSWYEITVEGKKICGSAQKRGGGVWMQHGAILLEHDIEMLVEVLKSGKSKQEFMDEIFSSTTSINNHLGKKIDFFELKALVLKGFETNLGIILERGNLTSHEYKLKNQLLEEKYLNKQWNLRTSSSNKGSSSIRTQVV
ncbi:MAG: lipoate--protein ligase family protein [Thermodesulfovibrionia bacterium]|nr:lipoate--protein ligase family protein [Thermodesulfovibrionia bacterium]